MAHWELMRQKKKNIHIVINYSLVSCVSFYCPVLYALVRCALSVMHHLAFDSAVINKQ